MYNVQVNIKYSQMSDSEADVLRENIMFFCNTPKGSLPQNREYGLDSSIMDESFPILRMRATVDIVTGIRKFYKVNLTEIKVTADSEGGIKVKVCV